jgi:DNA repair photolyase
MVSIGTLDDNERKKLEPQSSSIQNRLKILEIFSNIDIKTSVFFGPVYPSIKIEDLPNIIDVFMDHGVSEIMVDKLNLKPGILENLGKIIPTHLDQIKNGSNFKHFINEMCEISKNKNIKIASAF